MKNLIWLSLLLASSCGSIKKTTYHAHEKNEGYWDSASLDGLKIAGFRGNHKTKKSDAETYAHFRAIEQCYNDAQKIPLVVAVDDKTLTKNVTRGSSYGYPSYYYGMSPYYGRYSSFGVGFQNFNMNTWEETEIYPVIEVQYMCLKKIYKPKLELKDIPSADMKLLVKDLRGAIQLVTVPDHSPNLKNFEEGDLIIKADGKRIDQSRNLLKMLNTHDNHSLMVDVLREGVMKKNIKLGAVDVNETEKKAQGEVINWVCQKKEAKDHSICRANLSIK